MQKNVKKYFPIIESKTHALLDQIEKSEYSIDVHQLFMCFTIDITTEIAFGYELNTLDQKADEFQAHLEKVFPAINRRISQPFPMWKYIKNNQEKALEASLELIEGIINKFIDEAETKLSENPSLRENPSNFLEALLVESENEQFSKKEVFGNVFTMLLAGEDTTSNSLSWAAYFLCLNPKWIELAKNEAEENYSERVPPNDETLAKLKIANAIAQEAMRMRPTTPQLFMQANEDIVVNDIEIKKIRC